MVRILQKQTGFKAGGAAWRAPPAACAAQNRDSHCSGLARLAICCRPGPGPAAQGLVSHSLPRPAGPPVPRPAQPRPGTRGRARAGGGETAAGACHSADHVLTAPPDKKNHLFLIPLVPSLLPTSPSTPLRSRRARTQVKGGQRSARLASRRVFPPISLGPWTAGNPAGASHEQPAGGHVRQDVAQSCRSGGQLPSLLLSIPSQRQQRLGPEGREACRGGRAGAVGRWWVGRALFMGGWGW